MAWLQPRLIPLSNYSMKASRIHVQIALLCVNTCNASAATMQVFKAQILLQGVCPIRHAASVCTQPQEEEQAPCKTSCIMTLFTGWPILVPLDEFLHLRPPFLSSCRKRANFLRFW